jgi:hypothetical protein
VKILVVDSIAGEGLAYLRERGFEVDELVRPKAEALYARIGDYDALITRSLTAVTPDERAGDRSGERHRSRLRAPDSFGLIRVFASGRSTR